MMIDDKSLILKLMHLAFLDIRTVAYENKSHKAIFKIADIFHNIPLQLERVEKENGDYNKILNDIRVRAIRNECEFWLDNAIQNINK